MSAGRNDPCPCGSGRKYKHCCLAREAADAARADSVAALNDAATAHQRVGRLDEAIGAYRRALALAPRKAELHFNLGTALQAGGDVDGAIAAYRTALDIDARLAVAHHNLANALRARGDLDAALSHYRRAAALQPRALPAHVDLARLLHMLGDPRAAIASYATALRIEPRNATLHAELAGALEDAGEPQSAIAAYRRALELDDAPAIRASFARCIARTARLPDDPALFALIARAIHEAWTRPNDLARVASAALSRRAVDDEATRPLLLAVLEHARVCDPGLERTLAHARRALIASADTGAALEPTPLQCALAHQCAANEHVFAVADDEESRAQSLRKRLADALHTKSAIAATWIVAVGAYYPLADVPGIDELPTESWSPAVASLLARCVTEPRAERRARAALPSLTEIDDPVSQRVRAQYEANPYPRWTAVPRPPRTGSFRDYLRALFPLATIAPAPPDAPEVLVAGCGTGQEPLELAQLLPAARITAVDLSRASLAYAQRKTREAKIRNIEYAQADLLKLPSTGRSYDVISAVGVLHHLADPAVGLRALVAMLRPGGFMRLGFYSERGRADVVAAREFIAAHGFDASLSGIRRARQALVAEGAAFERLLSRIGFYATSECRDLLLHEQEHRFTLPTIRALLDDCGLHLVGLLLEPAIAARYSLRFPHDRTCTDLGCWTQFEEEHPAAFAGMYRFWVRRTPA